MPEDPVQDRAEGAGACPCFVRLRFVRVDGDSASRVLSTLAKLAVPGAIGKTLYHAALEVQVPEGGDCQQARRILELVAGVPTKDYSTDWTSNSVVSWLLGKEGLHPGGLSPPVGGMTSNWQNGVNEARQ